MRSGFKCKFYPNGEFSIGYVPDRRIDSGYRKPDPNAFRYGQLWWFHQPELRRWVEEGIANGEREPLDSSMLSNSHRRRGLNGITRKGGRLVRNTAHMMQAKWGRKRLSFLTLTLPPFSPSEERHLCSEWSRVVRVFCQRLRRLLIERGLPAGYVGVTEIQEKRWNRSQEVGLHLHIVFVGRVKLSEGWRISPGECREAWLSVLSTVVERPVYSQSCENLKMVKKSASGYLGKYMSKGTKIVSQVVDAKGEEYIPSAWYTCSQSLKDAYVKSVAVAWDDDVHIVSRLPVFCGADVIRHVGISTIDIHGREMVVGISGRFDMDNLGRYASSIRSLVPSSRSYVDKNDISW